MKIILSFILMPFYLSSVAQMKSPPYFIIQAGGARFQNVEDILASASVTVGTKVKPMLGIGANVQYMKFKGDRTPYLPIAADFSFMKDSRRVSPYFNAQAGGLLYHKSTSVYINGIAAGKTKVNGGLYLSPGVGMLVPINSHTKFLVSLGYFYMRMKYKASLAFNNRTESNSSSDYIDGFKLMVGLKF